MTVVWGFQNNVWATGCKSHSKVFALDLADFHFGCRSAFIYRHFRFIPSHSFDLFATWAAECIHKKIIHPEFTVCISHITSRLWNYHPKLPCLRPGLRCVGGHRRRSTKVATGASHCACRWLSTCFAERLLELIKMHNYGGFQTRPCARALKCNFTKAGSLPELGQHPHPYGNLIKLN